MHMLPLWCRDATPRCCCGEAFPRAPGHCQCRVGFGNSLPIRPPPISDGVAAFGCSMGAGDNLVSGAAGGAHNQPVTKQSSGLFWDELVQQCVKLGYKCNLSCQSCPVTFWLPHLLMFVKIARVSAQGLWVGVSVCRELLLLD